MPVLQRSKLNYSGLISLFIVTMLSSYSRTQEDCRIGSTGEARYKEQRPTLKLTDKIWG